jgi:D-psicose/D-tagatose/L-ribulose 3-epimerase
MKLGMNLHLWTTNVTPQNYYPFKKIKDAGYDGVQIGVAPGNENLYVEIRKQVHDAGLTCTTVTNGGPDANPISPDPTVRRRAVDQLRRRTSGEMPSKQPMSSASTGSYLCRRAE